MELPVELLSHVMGFLSLNEVLQFRLTCHAHVELIGTENVLQEKIKQLEMLVCRVYSTKSARRLSTNALTLVRKLRPVFDNLTALCFHPYPRKYLSEEDDHILTVFTNVVEQHRWLRFMLKNDSIASSTLMTLYH